MTFAPLQSDSTHEFPRSGEFGWRNIRGFCTPRAIFGENPRLQLAVIKALSAPNLKTRDAKPLGARARPTIASALSGPKRASKPIRERPDLSRRSSTEASQNALESKPS